MAANKIQITSLINKWNRVLGEGSLRKASQAGNFVRLPLPHPEIPGLWGQTDVNTGDLTALAEVYIMIAEIEAVPEVVAEIQTQAKTRPTAEMLKDIEEKEAEILARPLDGEFN